MTGNLTVEEREEFVRLRREVRTLRQQRDIGPVLWAISESCREEYHTPSRCPCSSHPYPRPVQARYRFR